MGRHAADYGFADRPLDAAELEVLGDALDSYQEAMRYAAGLADGDDRRHRFDRARVATKLLGRVHHDERALA